MELAEDARFSNLPRKLKVKINPEGTLSFDLIFRPKDVSAHAFALPLTVLGAGKLPDLEKQVTAKGRLPRLKVEPGIVVDFEHRVLHVDPAKRVPYALTLKLRNLDERRDLSWRADISNLVPSFGTLKQAFYFEPDRGVLGPAGVTHIKVKFQPDVAPKQYINTVPIFVIESPEDEATLSALLSPRSADTGRRPASMGSSRYLFNTDSAGLIPDFELELRGSAIEAQLSFDTREVILPPVPLGVESRATFYVISNGYDHLALQHAFVSWTPGGKDVSGMPAPISIPITVSYPQGNILSFSRPRLPVVVSLKATAPIALTSLLQFTDSGGNAYSIPISCVADNSVLSVHQYLESHASQLTYEGPLLDIYGPIKLVARRPPPSRTTSRGAPSSAAAGGSGTAGIVSGRPTVSTAPAPSPTITASGGSKPKAGPPPTGSAQPSPAAGSASGGVVVPPLGGRPARTSPRASSPPPLPPFPVGEASSAGVGVSALGLAHPSAVSGGGSGGAGAGATQVAYPTAPPPSPLLAPAAISILLRCLNSLILRAPIASFPDDIVAAHGKPIFDAIESLSGQALPGRLKSRVPPNKKERATVLFGQAKEVLQFLKSQGKPSDRKRTYIRW